MPRWNPRLQRRQDVHQATIGERAGDDRIVGDPWPVNSRHGAVEAEPVAVGLDLDHRRARAADVREADRAKALAGGEQAGRALSASLSPRAMSGQAAACCMWTNAATPQAPARISRTSRATCDGAPWPPVGRQASRSRGDLRPRGRGCARGTAAA